MLPENINAKWVAAFAATFALGSLLGWFSHQYIFNKPQPSEKAQLSMSSEMTTSPRIPLENTDVRPLSQATLTETLDTLSKTKQQKTSDTIKPQWPEDAPRWQRNSKPVELKKDHKYIAIVIDDVGVVRRNSEAVVRELPNEVTLAFLPYGESTPHLSKEAFNAGHEIMVHMPMQPKAHADGYVADPGPDALYRTLSFEEITNRARKHTYNLKEISVGANNHMGSSFTEWQEGMEKVLMHIAEEKLMFMDSITTAQSRVFDAAHGKNLPLLKRDVFLDHSIDKNDIRKALEKAERVAKKQGYAIAIGHPHPETTGVLKEWIATLEQKQIQLVPITTLIQKEN